MPWFRAPPPIYVPHGTGPAAMNELASVDWAHVKHCYGRGPLDYLGSHFDVAASLRDIDAADPERADEALLSFWDTLCHQGTIYEASARALPFLAAWLAGSQDDDRRSNAVVHLVVAIAAAACLREPASGSYAGAWGKGVRELTRTALTASLPYLEAYRHQQPRRQELVALLRAAAGLTGADEELAQRLHDEMDRS